MNMNSKLRKISQRSDKKVNKSREREREREGRTCNAKKNSTKGNPSLAAISFEVIKDIFRVKSFENGRVMLEQVEEANATNE